MTIFAFFHWVNEARLLAPFFVLELSFRPLVNEDEDDQPITLDEEDET